MLTISTLKSEYPKNNGRRWNGDYDNKMSALPIPTKVGWAYSIHEVFPVPIPFPSSCVEYAYGRLLRKLADFCS